MKAVVLAGGLGTRLKPFTEIIPKPLLPIGEKAILEIQIESLKKYGFDEIYLATNYKTEYIESFLGDGSRYGVSLHISRENEPLGTAGPLVLLKDRLTEPFILMNGDILSSVNLEKFYKFGIKASSLICMAIKKEIFPFAFGNIEFEGDYVTQIREKPDIITYIVAGIYFVKPELIKLIPENTYFGMDRLLKLMLEKNLKVSKYELDEYWLDIGRINDYEQAQDFYEKHFKDNKNG